MALTGVTRRRIVSELADGGFHSGEALAQAVGVSRAAVWKQMRCLAADLGLDVHAVRGRGYRLARPLDLLDSEKIRGHLRPEAGPLVADIHVHQSIDSTNSWLMRHAAAGERSGVVCLAETQTAGRGRHGRTWVSPYGENLYVSLLWRYGLPPIELAGLSLACGVAVAGALERLGVEGLGLKWPNDLQWHGRKLGGLLLEVRGEASGPSLVVVGLGLNVRLSEADAEGVAQPWACLGQVPGLPVPSRNRLAGLLAGELVLGMQRFGSEGFGAFAREWGRYDVFRGRRVRLRIGDREVLGDYMGIAGDGAVRIGVNGRIQQFHAGEVDLCRPEAS